MYDQSLSVLWAILNAPANILSSEEQGVASNSTWHRGTDSSEYHHPGSLSGGPVQLYNRCMGQDVKQARPITSRRGMSALLALLNCTLL